MYFCRHIFIMNMTFNKKTNLTLQGQRYLKISILLVLVRFSLHFMYFGHLLFFSFVRLSQQRPPWRRSSWCPSRGSAARPFGSRWGPRRWGPPWSRRPAWCPSGSASPGARGGSGRRTPSTAGSPSVEEEEEEGIFIRLCYWTKVLRRIFPSLAAAVLARSRLDVVN